MADENTKALSDLTKSMKDSNKLASENLEIQKKRQVEDREAAKALQKSNDEAVKATQKSNDEIAKVNKKTANDSINKTKEFWKHYTVEAEKQLIATKDAEKKGTKVLEELSKTSKAQLAQGEKGLEEKQDDKKAVKIAADEGKKQTSLLSGIFGKSKDAIKDNPVFGFLKKHWGKLLLGFGAVMLLFETPIKDLVIGFKKVVGFLSKLTPTKIGIAIATAIAAKKALDVGGEVLKDTVKISLLKKLFTRAAPAAAAIPVAPAAAAPAAAATGGATGTGFWIGLKSAIQAAFKGGIASPAAIAIALVAAIYDGVKGFFKSDEWGVSKISGTLGGFFGGSDNGSWMNVASKMGQGAAFGARLGMSFGPYGIIVGGILGAIGGALLGIIGGENLALWFEKIGVKMKSFWETDVVQPFSNFWDTFHLNVITPLADTFQAIMDFIKPIAELFKPLKEWIKKTLPSIDSIRSLLGFGEGEQQADLDAAKKQLEQDKKNSEQMAKDKKLANANLRVKRLEEEIAEQQADIDAGNTHVGFDSGPFQGTDKKVVIARKQEQLKVAREKVLSAAGAGAAPVTTDSDSGLTSTPATVNKTKMKNPLIPDDGGTTNMDGVNWDKMGGRDAVESEIWNIYNKHGKKPTFVSGLRDKNHALYNPNSQHAYGLGFDLRSKGLGSAKSAISSDLSDTFNRKGWFMQEEMAGQANSTGTRATGEHFHIHKAAKGFHGWVNEATGFIAGEAGKERIDITPMSASQPQDRMHGLNELQNQNLDAKQQASAPIIISPTQVSTVNNSNSGSTNVIGASGAGNPSRIDKR